VHGVGVPVLTSRLQQACKLYFNREPLIVDESIKTGIQLQVDDPKTVALTGSWMQSPPLPYQGRLAWSILALRRPLCHYGGG